MVFVFQRTSGRQRREFLVVRASLRVTVLAVEAQMPTAACLATPPQPANPLREARFSRFSYPSLYTKTWAHGGVR